jgi:hypothetical protein
MRFGGGQDEAPCARFDSTYRTLAANAFAIGAATQALAGEPSTFDCKSAIFMALVSSLFPVLPLFAAIFGMRLEILYRNWKMFFIFH